MKTEYREITVKQPVYIADDGKEFTDEEECEDYEFSILKDSIKYYDSDYNEVDDPESCEFVYLDTIDDINKFIRICDVYGITTKGIDVNKTGVYIYGYRDCWVNIEDAVSRIRGGGA